MDLNDLVKRIGQEIDAAIKIKLFSWLFNKMPILIKAISFGIVGLIGIAVNGFVFIMLGSSGLFAWFMGILTAFIMNFILNYLFVFNQGSIIKAEQLDQSEKKLILDWFASWSKYKRISDSGKLKDFEKNISLAKKLGL